MENNKKALVFNNLFFMTALLTTCLRLFNKLYSILTMIDLSDHRINHVDYQFYELIVYTDRETYHLELYFPLIIIIIGIGYNLRFYLKYILKDK